MDFIGSALVIIGYILMAVESIWVLVLAFQDSVVLGILSLIIPFVIIYATVKTWPESKTPLLSYLAGFAVALIGAVIVGAGEAG